LSHCPSPPQISPLSLHDALPILPGANGSLAAMNVLKATPDGYTLLGTTGTDFLVAPLTMAAAKYKLDNFKLVGVVGISDIVLVRSEEHTSELQSQSNLVCRLLLE